MLRYRVAVMLWLFLLLGTAGQGGLQRAGWRMLWAVIILAGSYVAATSVNDIADEPIDRINHPGDRDRPLVTGDAVPADLWTVHAVAAGVTLIAAVPLGGIGVALAAGSLLIGWAYSLRPLRLSHRALATPLTLSVAYVAIPFALGVELAGGTWTRMEVGLVTALGLLFGSRIVLKDFRDRPGDAAYGKGTLLLRFGKLTTVMASLVALVLGNIVLVVAIQATGAILVLIEAFVAAIVTRLHALWRARDGWEEQLAIGLGARLGNGLLLMIAGWLALGVEGAPEADRLLFAAAIAVVFGASFAVLIAHPERAVIGYKG